LCYADAVTLLGGHGRVVAALDRLTGGLLLAASAAGSGFALSLFDAKLDRCGRRWRVRTGPRRSSRVLVEPDAVGCCRRRLPDAAVPGGGDQLPVGGRPRPPVGRPRVSRR